MTTQTNIPTNNLGQLLQDIDRLQVNRRPLAPHAIANGNDEDKKTYATMLAVLMVNQSISDAQSRLLTMLLHSMDLDIPLSSLYDRVSSFDKQALEAFCELVDSDALAPAFFMDALTLLRLDKPLSEVQVKSLSELTTLLEVPQSVIEDILHLSNKVLHNGDKDAFSVEAMAKAKFHLNLDFDYDSLKPWHEFSYRSLTEQDLETNKITGTWVVNKKITLEHSLTIQDAILMFSPDASLTMKYGSDFDYIWNVPKQRLNTYKSYLTQAVIIVQEIIKDNSSVIWDVEIYDSSFINSSIMLTGTKTEIKNCNFSADKIKVPAIEFNSNKSEEIEIYNSKFKIKNNIAVQYDVDNSNLFLIENCEFKECDNALMEKAGAITLVGKITNFEVKNSQFTDNKSKHGSAIYFVECNNISECKIENSKFTNNASSDDADWLRTALNNLVIRAKAQTETSLLIENCYFKNAFSKIFFVEHYKFQKTFKNCNFQASAVLVNVYGNDEYRVFQNCNFKNPANPNLILIPNDKWGY